MGWHSHELHSRNLLTTQNPKSANEPPPVRLLQHQIRPLGSITLVVLLCLSGLNQNAHLCLYFVCRLIGVLVDPLERSESLLVPTFGGEPSGRFGDKEAAAKDTEGDDEDESDGEAV